MAISFARRLGLTNSMKSATGSIKLDDLFSISLIGELHDIFVKIWTITYILDFFIQTHEMPRMEVIFGRPLVATIDAKL